jgi:signal transduction histidine kinase
MNFGKATSWRRDGLAGDKRDAAFALPAEALRKPLRHTAKSPPARPEDLLGGAYGASWRDSPDILFALRATPDGLVFDALNPACEKSLRVCAADVVGQSPLRALPPAAAGPFLVGCQQCAGSAKTTRFTHAMTLERRRRRWDTTLTPVCGEDGKVFLILARSREIAGAAEPGRACRRAAARQAMTSKARGLSVTRDWRITEVSPEAASWMGVEQNAYLGRDAREGLLFSGEMFGAVEAALTVGEPSQLRLRSLFRPGRWLEFEVEPTDAGADIRFSDAMTEPAGPEAPRAIGLLEYGAGSDAVEMALLDARGFIVSVNTAWREAFAMLQSGGRGFGVETPYETVCRRIIPDLDPGVLHEAMRQLLAREVHTLTHAYVVVTEAGPRWRQIRIAPLRAGVAHFIALHEDLTEVARTQAALRRTTEQLLSVQQEERERIAIELHDSTGQHLAALGMGVSRLRRLMGDKEKAQGILDDMATSLEEAVKEIRVMSYLMKPPSLLRDGLESTARRYVQGFGIRTGLDAVFSLEGPVDAASPMVQHAAFRVIQEALSNVHRHAHARGVQVRLASQTAALTLRIADNGKGMAPFKLTHLEGIPPGVGITGMRSRVEQLGGWLDIASDRAGTVVSASIPLPEGALAAPMARQ